MVCPDPGAACPGEPQARSFRTTELLRTLPRPEPAISDDVAVRVPRRRRWWAVIPGLGQASARRIKAFFAEHPQLTERARALIAEQVRGVVVPWEQLRLPHEVDGSQGQFRAPRETCVLTADNGYEAVQAWLSLHESPATQRVYREEAERLILWAIVERGRPLSSLTTEDAIAWALVRTIADGLEWSYGWEVPGAQRLRFVLDFGYATGLRASELVSAKLGNIEADRHGDHWLNLVGKGSRAGVKRSLKLIQRFGFGVDPSGRRFTLRNRLVSSRAAHMTPIARGVSGWVTAKKSETQYLESSRKPNRNTSSAD